MLYYIVPPIIIILATATLIYFLFRKVSEFPNNDRLLRNSQQQEGMVREKMRAAFSAMGQFGLRFLERTMHHFKLLSLKFHNTSNDWFHSIRKKREEVMLAENEHAKKEEDRLAGTVSGIETAAAGQRELLQPKKVVRPLVSEISAGERKNQLEEALIRRIAVNPRDIEAYERLGDYYFERQNLKDSLECYKQVLHLSPAHFKARSKIRKIQRMLDQ